MGRMARADKQQHLSRILYGKPVDYISPIQEGSQKLARQRRRKQTLDDASDGTIFLS